MRYNFFNLYLESVYFKAFAPLNVFARDDIASRLKISAMDRHHIFCMFYIPCFRKFSRFLTPFPEAEFRFLHQKQQFFSLIVLLTSSVIPPVFDMHNSSFRSLHRTAYGHNFSFLLRPITAVTDFSGVSMFPSVIVSPIFFGASRIFKISP